MNLPTTLADLATLPLPVVGLIGSLMAALIGAFASMGSALVTHFLTRRRNANETIWELRRIAYSRILADLTEIERLGTLWMALRGVIWEHEDTGDREVSGARSLHREVNMKMDELRRNYADSYLIMSPEFRKEIGYLPFELYENLGPETEFLERRRIRNKVQDWHAAVLPIALKEMGMPVPARPIAPGESAIMWRLLPKTMEKRRKQRDRELELSTREIQPDPPG